VFAITAAEIPRIGKAEDALEIVRGVDLQPLAAQAKRVAQALDQMLGAPLSERQQADLDAALKLTDADKAAEAIQKILDPLCVVAVTVNPESRVKVARGPAAAKREAKLMFDVGQGTQDLGFRNEVAMLCTADPAVEVKLEIIDDDGKPTMGQFVIRDRQGRVYPSRIRRLAPDLFFHDQIYRNH